MTSFELRPRRAGEDPLRRWPVGTTYEGQARGAGARVALAASRFNQAITDRLLVGALDGLQRHGVDPASITVAWVPGAFELPLVARRLAASGEFDAVVCLGAVIRGETGHYEHVAGQCAAGIQRSQLETGVPVVFGVLTTETVEQALARSRPISGEDAGDGEDTGTGEDAGGGDGGADSDNKGFESVVTALEMADLLRQLPTPC